MLQTCKFFHSSVVFIQKYLTSFISETLQKVLYFWTVKLICCTVLYTVHSILLDLLRKLLTSPVTLNHTLIVNTSPYPYQVVYQGDIYNIFPKEISGFKSQVCPAKNVPINTVVNQSVQFKTDLNIYSTLSIMTVIQSVQLTIYLNMPVNQLINYLNLPVSQISSQFTWICQVVSRFSSQFTWICQVVSRFSSQLPEYVGQWVGLAQNHHHLHRMGWSESQPPIMNKKGLRNLIIEHTTQTFVQGFYVLNFI